jgi:hypothetical protein
VKNYEIYLGDL